MTPSINLKWNANPETRTTHLEIKQKVVPLTGCWAGWISVVIWDCPLGAVTDTVPGSLACTSILYPGGRNVLNPTINSGCPLNRDDTRLITPGVSMLGRKKEITSLTESLSMKSFQWILLEQQTCRYLWDLNSFIMSRKSLYTWGWFPNWSLTWSKYDKASSTLK